MPIARTVALMVLHTLAAELGAQAVLRVPSQFPTPAAAVAAAAPGDTVLLDTVGPHAPFNLSKGLTILAGPAGAEIFEFGALVSTVQVPAGERAVFDGITFSTAGGLLGSPLRVTGGDVLFRGCSFSLPGFGPPTALAACEVVGGAASFEDCQMLGGYPWFALSAQRCRVSLVRCSLATMRSGIGLPSQVAVALTDTAAQISFCTVTGADSLWPATPAGAAAMVVNAGSVSIADSVFQGGGSVAGPGASALVVAAGASVRVHQASFQSGLGLPAPPVVGTTTTGPVLRAAAVPAPVAATTWSVPVRGEASSVVGLFAASGWTVRTVPGVDATWWLGTSGFALLGWTTLDAMGRGTVAVPLPATLPTGLVSLQLLGFANGSAQASPPYSVRI